MTWRSSTKQDDNTDQGIDDDKSQDTRESNLSLDIEEGDLHH